MIHVFMGTKAQFIKMAPLMTALERNGLRINLIDSGQHATLTRRLRGFFGIRQPDTFLWTKDVTSRWGALVWVVKVMRCLALERRKILSDVFRGDNKGLCLVHGDTLTTLIGAVYAKACGLRLAHVEAGLRSYSWFHPFPEELVRFVVSHMAEYLFAPSRENVSNLVKSRVRGKIICTHGNTVRDSLRTVLDSQTCPAACCSPCALVTCHRFETIYSRQRAGFLVDTVCEVAEKLPVVFVLHPPTRKQLERFRLIDNLKNHPNISLRPILDYPDFIALLAKARLVVTDGGSIQEECAALEKPCLILRERTERSDGLGKNAVLGRFDMCVLRSFLRDHCSQESECRTGEIRPPTSATETIVKFLLEQT